MVQIPKYILLSSGAILISAYFMRRQLNISFQILTHQINLKFKETYFKDIKKEFIYDELIKLNEKPLKILEIGSGFGTNFNYYPPGSQLICIDKNTYCERYLYNNLLKHNSNLELQNFEPIHLNETLIAYAENMSYIRDDSVPIIVCTFTLSCVLDIEQCLNEIHRILKPMLTVNASHSNISTQTIEPLTLTWDKINVYSNKKRFSGSCCKNKNNVATFADNHSDDADLETNGNVEEPLKLVTTDTSLKDKKLKFDSQSNKDPNQILNNVNGIAHSGQSIAILGSSGAGKTTFLNVLNFRISKKFSVDGEVKINGKKVTAEQLGSQIGYVQQDDVFIGTLTVYEHLKFLAMLKMPKHYSKSERLKRVEDVLAEFNLSKCRNTKIGFVDRGGISGGEKRRLSLASEILTDPQILFCDEPTSGLDSHMAQIIVNTLSRLARKGKIIISTIHQPSSQVYGKFDGICLLSQGRVAYFGDRAGAFTFFTNLGYICPPQYNPADYFIEMLSTKSNDHEGIERIQSICNSFNASDAHKKIIKEISEETAEKHNESTENAFRKRIITEYKASYFTQFIWLLWRQFKNTIREPFATWIIFAQSVIIGFFYGLTYFQEKNNQTSIQNKNGLIFMMIMQAVFAFLFSAVSSYFNQWTITRREVKSRIYSILVYYTAKTLAEVPQNIIFPFITTTIIYWMANIHPDVFVYLKVTLIIVLTSNASVGFGSVLAMLSPNIDSTIGLIGPTVMPLLVFSGFLINNESMPIYFFWIKYVSWIYYAFEAIMITIWSNTETIGCDGGVTLPIFEMIPFEKLPPNLTEYLSTINITDLFPSDMHCIKDGQAVLSQLSIDSYDFERDICMLLLLVTVFPVLAGIMIYIRSRL